MRCVAVIGIVFVVASVVLSNAGTLQAEPHYRERIEYFDISSRINSRRDLWQAIRDWGPSRHHYVGGSDSTIVGMAKPRFGYEYELQRRGDRCHFRKLEVDVAIVIRLPAWDDKKHAEPDLQTYYQCILNTVTVHEKRHAQIAYEAGEEIEARFYSELDGTSCRGFDAHAKNIFDNVIHQQNRRQVDFDRRDYARNRYQQCATGGTGPLADANSQPRPNSFDIESSSKWRDVESDLETQPKKTVAEDMPTGSRDGERSGADASSSGSFALETTMQLFFISGCIVLALFSFGGLFAVIMFAANRYEKSRGYFEHDALSGDFSQSQPKIGVTGQPPGERALGLEGQPTSRQVIFGKRGRER